MDGFAERLGERSGLVKDAHAFALAAVRAGGKPPVPPGRLYLTGDEIRDLTGDKIRVLTDDKARVLTGDEIRVLTDDKARALTDDKARALTDDKARAAMSERDGIVFSFEDEGQRQNRLSMPLSPASAVRQALAWRDDGLSVVLCTDEPPQRVRPLLARRLGQDDTTLPILENWAEAEAFGPGRIGLLQLRLPGCVRLRGHGFVALRIDHSHRDQDDPLERLTGAIRFGDLVVDRERGLARLTGLAMEDAGASRECLVLEFLGGSRLLMPATEAARVWRYGATGAVGLNRLDGTAWRERRDQAEREIAALAAALVDRMRARAEAPAPALRPGPAYQRFVRRMPFTATADQVRAIRAVREDMASGRKMYRLVCGDVGFGKTEIALHAAAIAALDGKQVAVIAPTTLLARQHAEVFRRRLAGLGVTVGSLIGSSRSAAGTAVLHGLETGAIDIVVGTHAVQAARFRDLGLVVIDEEQRFGLAQKRRLRDLQNDAHTLVMTATPLPRSLQSALLGLIDVSLLATPPANRLPVRALVAPLDAVLLRTALLHEARRGGQSFVVCPRIADIPVLERRLRDTVPELSLAVVHGRMKNDDLDTEMLLFGRGERDILLATNIIEAGLDLPNANTMLIWQAERFGLGQLHQLRGRVGRGRTRASLYLLTDPAHPPSAAARKRLETVAALDSLGAGFAISLADLDQRGAGDLLGDDQAGHLRLIGTDLYRYVLSRALARAHGETVEETPEPDIALDVPAYLPNTYIPEADTRLRLYHRLASLEDEEEIGDMAAEFADRFGVIPPPAGALLDLARLRLRCRAHRIAAIQAGPRAVALVPASGERRILPIQEPSPFKRLQALLAALA